MKHGPSIKSLRSVFFVFLHRPETSSSFPRGSRHPCGQMISRTVLAFLRLNGLIIHVHVVLDRRNVLVAKQFLEAEWIIAQHQVANGKSMAQDMGTDALVSNPCSFADPLEKQLNPIFCQWGPRFRKKEMSLTR